MMKIFIAILLVSIGINAHAENPIDILEKALTSDEDNLHKWEKKFSKEDWADLLYDCRNRSVSYESKESIKKLLNNNDPFQSKTEADIDTEITSYCLHVFLNGKSHGVSLKVAPNDSSNLQAQNTAKSAKACYGIQENGFSDLMKKNIKIAAMASRELLGIDKSEPLSLKEVSVAYMAWCNAIFTNNEDHLVTMQFIP